MAVGEAFLSAFLQVLFDRLASREVVNFFKTGKVNHRLLKELEITMTSVHRVLGDAEEKLITNPAVKKWVTELKDAVYKAEDLLDEIAYEALKEAGSETNTDEGGNLSSSRGFEVRLKEILEILGLLVQQKDALGLREGIGEKQLWQRTTTSLVDESGVFGRDADKEEVMKMVLQSESDDASGNKLFAIPIVGMGGVGKTTLAQLVYSKIQQRFALKAWVCVSEEKDPFVVTKQILKELTSSNCDNMSTNRLQLQLRGILEGKRFLLVLDDIWNDSSEFWDVLQQPLRFGAQGSVIMVTTRTESVATAMVTVHAMRTLPYPLKQLNDDDSWLLFVRHAFGDENSNAPPDLEAVGRSIVKKCKGLPLAAKSLGGLLRSNREVNDWKNILKSNLWELRHDKIIAPLWLSYRYLPLHLKQCFAYCALFPKDYVFKKKELILLWMAEGFLVPAKGDGKMEEIGDQYFEDLVSRSFFSLNCDRSYSMHDIIHNLAESVSENFYLKLENDHSCNIITKHTRHLSFIRGWHNKTFMEVCNNAVLRTILLVGEWYNWFDLNVGMENDLMPALKKLRVLSLSNFPYIVSMSDLISKMKYLRYLNLSATNIKVLPESIQNLYNLQILILWNCFLLKELPANIVKLINLFHLDIGGTTLKKMPLQMGKLTKLQKLSYFTVGEPNGSRISELGELKHLRGELQIRGLQKVRDPQDALDANLKDKEYLKELELEWSWDRDINNQQNETGVLEKLQPHSNMERLKIYGYGGTSFASWVGESLFSSMISLTIEKCNKCRSLPPLGQLPSLKSLNILELYEVAIVGRGFYGSSMKPFPSLESLRFENMPQWEEWKEVGAFPVLQELIIRNCPKLKKSLPSHLPCLSKLEIRECDDQFLTSLPVAPHFTTTSWPSSDYQMGQMALFSATLEYTYICRCNSVKCFPLELFPKLKELHISNSTNLESLVVVENMHGNFTTPESLQLTNLLLRDCPSLKSLPKRMESLLAFLESLEIHNCPNVEGCSEGGLPSKLKSLKIVGCKKFVAGYKQWNLRRLSSLSKFNIGNIDDVSFPEKTLLPSTLRDLSITNFTNLRSLGHEGLQHLTNLESLAFADCQKLQCLPEEGLPISLGSLVILDCPLLEQRCEREKGEYWPKIAHIPHVRVDQLHRNTR